ncbi:DUF2235 domain-containing protein [Desulfovibrio inopinatus]|uniref:DUF2235 domain-containing protein n=1 Tax=Desulfovibrio inopinatus TaxID=102109 RepID=UPI00042562B2|nr:DUF2235 domain-containing protein [Desulfovibrio inopinatus]
MKRLIVCCDGTWNKPEQEENGIPAPTNVFKLYNAVADQGPDATRQLKYYHPGVGSGRSLFDRIAGGAIGFGMSRNICSAYHWLATNYEGGDEIYLFGFSRGAFTVRSLAGFIGMGLLDLRGIKSPEAWRRVHTGYDVGYRADKEEKRQPEVWAESDWAFFNNSEPTPIHFLGVWDTVGALGIPDELGLLNLLDNCKKWRFHDTNISSHIKNACHAMAIDEVRSCFTVTHWANVKENKNVKEVWFPGSHSDVGGGYANGDLSNGALLWMMEESASKGLLFRPGLQKTIRANPLGMMHNSYKGSIAKLRSRPRNIPAMTNEHQDKFHQSAFQRQNISPISYPAYHPTVILHRNENVNIDVFADTHWNATNVYLEAGKSYCFSASGTWQDSKDDCDWYGTQNNTITSGDIVRAVASLWGVVESAVKKLIKNESMDFLMTKRVEDMPWFVMVGAIANDGESNTTNKGVHNDGSPVPHQYVNLTKHEDTPLTITRPGYLYCFPNDVWSFYGNNKGSIQLTITCV